MVRTVVDETPCRRCGYLLRGLPLDGRCPECAFSVRRSLPRHPLSRADARWLTAIVIGCAWLAAGVAGWAGLRLGAWAAGVAPPALFPLLSLLPTGAGVFGCWLMTGSEPDAPWEHRLGARFALRAAAAAYAHIALLRAGVALLSPEGNDPAVDLIDGLAVAARVAIAVAAMAHLRELAARVPDPPLEARLTRLAWAVVIALAPAGWAAAGLPGLPGVPDLLFRAACAAPLVLAAGAWFVALITIAVKLSNVAHRQ